jgi:hypothetical protein
MDKKQALRLMKDVNMKFIVDDEFQEEEFLIILRNYVGVEE